MLLALIPFLVTSDYQLILANQILLWGMFAVAFNLLFGVTGMLSFGQALYYGLGAYSVGLTVKYVDAAWFLPAMVLGIVLAVVLSVLVGLLTIRVSGVFFTVLTLAFGQLAWQITFKWYTFTCGDDGVQGIIPPGILGDHSVYYYFCLVLVLLSMWLMKRLAGSPMGLLLRGVRQNANRIAFLGQSVRLNQLLIYVVSSCFAALAGGMMAGVDGSIHPDMFYWTTSGEVVLMAVLGGIGQFFGPFVGAGVIIIIQDWVGSKTEYWPLVIGLTMMTMVLLLPRGLVGEVRRLGAYLKSNGGGNRG